MKLTELIPTHNKIRDVSIVYNFLSYFLSQENRLNFDCGHVTVLCTEDGRKYIWDAHHRIVAYYMLGGKEIPDSQIRKIEYNYSDLSLPNFGTGFYTPFDPRIECRLANFASFKNYCISANKDESLKRFILANSQQYKEVRRVNSISELILEG